MELFRTMEAHPGEIRVEELLAETTWVYRLACTLVADRGAAEDLVQETLCAGLETRRARPRELRAWLAGVVRRLALRRQRDETARGRREARAARPEAGPSACSTLEQAELQRSLLGAVLALEEPYRATVLARFFEGVSLEEIARRNGVPSSTARTWNQRALERLRSTLDHEYGGRESWAGLLLLGRRSFGRGASTASQGSKVTLGTAAVIAAVAGLGAVHQITRSPSRGSGSHLDVAAASAVAAAPTRNVSPTLSGLARTPISAAAPAAMNAFTGPSTSSSSEPLLASWQLTGVVTDPDGEPVEGAQVLWRGVTVFRRENVVLTDPEGRYSFEFPSQEDTLQVETVAARHPDWLPRAIRVRPGDFDDGLAVAGISLERGVAARFHVTNAQGRPVPDAKVRLTTSSPSSEGTLPIEREDWAWRDWLPVFRGERLSTAWTDDTGACSMAAVAQGTNALLVWAEGYLPEEQTVTIDAESIAPLRFTLARGGTIGGVVVDRAGAGVAGARVYACVSNAWAATTSRPDGTFELGGLRTTSDRASFCVVHPGFAPFWAGKREEEDARTTLDDQEVRIVLDQGRTVELQLVDGENGSFVAGPATLEVERVSSFVDAPVGAATREQSHDLVQGRLVAERLGSFVRVLWITCPGYDPLRLDLGAAAVGTGEVVRLRRSLRWELELADAATGMPILGGSLVIGIDTSPSPELPSAVAVSVDGSGTPRSVHGNRITIDSAWLRWQGRWTLQVSAPGFTPWTRETSAEEVRAGPAVLRVDLERLD